MAYSPRCSRIPSRDIPADAGVCLGKVNPNRPTDEARSVCDGGTRAGADDDVLAGEGADASTVARDFDGLWTDEASCAENEFHTVLTEAVLLHLDEAIHRAALAHRRHIDAGLRRME